SRSASPALKTSKASATGPRPAPSPPTKPSMKKLFPMILLASCVALHACNSNGTQTFSKSDEEFRVTSPTGQFDAVLIRKGYGGALGGFEWYLSIVPRGSAAIERTVVFQAGKMRGEKLTWSEPHLIELCYDVALIEHFRNLWSLDEIGDAGA